MNKDNKQDYQNSKSLYILKIIAMSFAILAVVVFVTVTLFKWISELNAKIKNSQTHIAKLSSRLNRLRKERIKHILKLRKEKKREDKKKNRKKSKSEDSEEVFGDEYDAGELDDDNSELNELDEEYLAEELEDIDNE